jgi:hypothetical protein
MLETGWFQMMEGEHMACRSVILVDSYSKTKGNALIKSLALAKQK